MSLLKTFKEKAVEAGRGVGERAKAYREEQVRHRGEVREVREKVAHSDLEKEAAPIAKKYGISLEEAIIWLQSEKKKKERAETLERIGAWGDDLGKEVKVKKRNGIEEYREFIGGDARFVDYPKEPRRKAPRGRNRRTIERGETGIEGVFFQPTSRKESSPFIPGERQQSGELAAGFIPHGRRGSRELVSGFVPQGDIQKRADKPVNITVLSRQNKPIDTFSGTIRHDFEYPYVIYKGQPSAIHKKGKKYYIYPEG